VALPVACLLLLTVWLAARPRPVPPPVAVVATIAREVEAPAATPAATADPCAATHSLLRLVADQQQQGKYLLAASNAELGLSQADVCAAHRDQLTRQTVVGRVQALWSESIRPDDRDAQQRAVDVYREAVALADRYDVPTARPSLQVVADRAYQSGQFLLARRALDELFESSPTAADRSLLRRYYAALRNLGVALARASSPSARDEGLALLVAAHLVDERYRLEQGEATRDLVSALGPDRAHWPAPAASPLLSPTARPAA
jgi:hypothetical protein